jgi:hypothetical protein
MLLRNVGIRREDHNLTLEAQDKHFQSQLVHFVLLMRVKRNAVGLGSPPETSPL